MVEVAGAYAVAFGKYLRKVRPGLVLIRGDRYEQLPLAMCAAYLQIPIVHLEGFDLSGAIDNKVRYAISHLSDYHFVTNEGSYKRAKDMHFENVWNCGSLDVEYAMSVKGDSVRERPYVMVLCHSMPNERPGAVLGAVETFKEYDVLGIRGNSDYGKSYGIEEYRPDEFIRLLRGASCIVGNSSAGIKEAGILGTPVVNVGSRQSNRLKTENVLDVPCETDVIKKAIEIQLNHGRYSSDLTYYQPNTSFETAKIINTLQS